MFEKLKAGLYTTTLNPPAQVQFIEISRAKSSVCIIHKLRSKFWRGQLNLKAELLILTLTLIATDPLLYYSGKAQQADIECFTLERFSDLKLTFQIIQTWMLNLISVKLEQQDKSNSCTNTRVSNMMDMDRWWIIAISM